MSTSVSAGRRGGFKSWFVEPFEQVRLGLMFLVVNMIFGGLIFGVFAYYIFDMYQAVSQLFALNQAESLVTFSKFRWPLIVGAVLIVLFIFTTILVAVRYTHAFYGPLISIHRFLDDILNLQKPKSLNLRESDQLQGLANKLNDVAVILGQGGELGELMSINEQMDKIISGNNPEPLPVIAGSQLEIIVKKLNSIADLCPKNN